MSEVGATSALVMNEQYASKFAELALRHVVQEYPNKLDHMLLSAADVRTPKDLHPIFFGSFDWHSCVHGYWMLARIYRQYPNIESASRIRELFNSQLTTANVEVERAYAAHPARGGFERPYGWAWLLMLQAELLQHTTPEGRGWANTLAPLAMVFSNRFKAFLPKATYAVRVGTHYNTAFAVALSVEYAKGAHDDELEHALVAAANRWYGADENAPAWEPNGDDFLSSTLIEAECMRRVLDPNAFREWFAKFLPRIAERQPATLFTPATVSDRSDGKTAHLDGMNLSRAWCWRTLATSLSADQQMQSIAHAAATVHLEASLPHVAGDYMGEHWLATYALLALDAGIAAHAAHVLSV